jgi:ribonuclease G
MNAELIINSTSHETRVALLENGQLCELHIERESDKGIVGNIYKGRIQRVLPGMQSAFVDAGLSRSAFLYIDDVYTNDKEFEAMISGLQDEADGIESPDDDIAPPLHPPPPPIEDILTDGMEILVQVIKEPLGTKGARISSHISLPGRYLVFLPTLSNIGISRRITDETERSRLRDIVSSIRPDNCGFIIRTASEGATRDELANDMDFLIKLWDAVRARMDKAPVPSLLHEDLSIALRSIRDLYTKNVRKVVVDSEKVYNDILQFVDTFMPQLMCSVELYTGSEPIFDAYAIEVEISRALGRTIWMKSGGYIVIEETEALVAIDVNTGRYVGKGNQADTILKTNLEAIREIAYQVRLRNLGGIIIIDFIDMERKVDRELVFNTLQEALKRDRAKTNVISMTELGLIQMTRKRVRENLSGLMCKPCPHCEGRGRIKATPAIAYEILRAIRREAGITTEETIEVLVHPDIIAFLYDEERHAIEDIEKACRKKIVIKADGAYHHEEFTLSSS